MRGSTTQTMRVVPRGEYMLTLKALGVLVDGSLEELREELYLTRKAIQYVIDCLWELDRLPTINQLHQMFYGMLRGQGFRAHQAKQIYKYARAVVKSARENNGGKPVLRKLSARIDKYDAWVDLENQLVIVKLRNRVFKIRVLHRRDYMKKFMDRKWYEVMVSVDKQGRIWVSIPFRWVYNPYKPRRAVSMDINLRKVVIFDGRRARRADTRFVEALKLKHLAESVQKRHSYAWKRNERWLEIIRALHRRSRNIVIDWCRKFAKYIVLKARRTRSAIALEDLEKLWFSSSRKSSNTADKLSRFAYRKLQLAIMTKAVEYNVPIIFVNPKNTSSTCPVCGARLEYNHRLAVCRKCGFMADRDTVGAINIHLRAVTIIAPRHGSWGTHPMTDEARPKGGTKGDEPMTTYIHSYTNI
ncbi:MAG: RNA-guided endonuclease TnpB family protein [Desulfurococcales archaeon]|nr:RNA-guided endonuclease TnpB family protein [Desulfurococcales archaeon]